MTVILVLLCWLALIVIFMIAWARSRTLGIDEEDPILEPAHEDIPS